MPAVAAVMRQAVSQHSNCHSVVPCLACLHKGRYRIESRQAVAFSKIAAAFLNGT